MVTLMDLNDAIIAGTAPTNPTEGTLWIDSSLTPPVLKKWSMGAWVTQAMDLTELDPDFTEYISKGVDQATAKLGNLSSDDKITATERQVILDKLTDMLGASPSGTIPLPAVATVNTYTAGEYYQTRKSATDAGVGTSDTAYTAYANAYTTLANYLNTILADGIYCWDVSNAKVETVHTIVGQTFRDNWKAFYQAQLVLQTRTSKRVSDAKAEAEAYTKSYREQLVGNGYAGVASNRNFSGFTYTTAQKVTGPGSFSRTATGETRTDEFIAVEPDRTYRLMVSVINSTTTGTHNIGLECYNAAGTSLGKRHLIRTSSNSTVIPSTTSFVHYEAVISGLNIGTGSVTDTDFPAGTTQVKVYFNTNNSTTTNTIYVADVSFALETIEANKDYNGISLSAAKGMVVTSTRNVAEFNATDGIKVYKKTDPANPVFKLDSATGDLTITGNINMMGGSITWANVNKPTAAQVGAATPDDVSSAVGNIKIGGRNLLLESARSVSSSAYNMTSYPITKTLTAGTSMTISMKATLGSGKRYFGIYNSGGNVQLCTLGPEQLGSDGVYRYTFPWVIGSSSNLNITIYHMDSSTTATSTIEWIKLEEGNKATDWTPAPEDTTAAINNIKIGGTNLIPNSSGEFLDSNNLPLNWATFNGSKNLQSISGRVNGKAVRVLMNGSSGGGQGIASPSTYNGAIIGGETYVVSFWVRTSVNMTVTHLLKFKNAANVSSNPIVSKNIATVANTWTRYEESFVAPNDAVELYTTIRIASAVVADATFDVDELKIEKGNKATDWSPAPEDINTSLSNLEIGGTNLLLDSEREQTSSTLVYYNFNGNRLAGREGKQMIISFDAKADADNVHVIDVYLRDMVNAALISGSQSPSFTLDGIYRRFSYAFTVPSNITTFPDVGIALRGNTAVSGGAANAGSYFIRKVQIEVGQNATDWSPAPEDTISKINAIQVGGTNLLWNSQFKDTYSTGNVTSKNPDLYAKLWGGYNAGVPNPTTSFHAHVDATTFGYNVYEYNESDGTRQWKGISITLGTITSGDFVFSGDFNATGLGTFTFGGFHYRKKGETAYGFHSGQFNIPIDSVNGWKRFSQAITLKDDVDLSQPVNFYIYGYGFSTNSIMYMKNVQLEKGNKMTEWSPAPEDSSLKISDLYTLTTSVGGVTVIDANKIQTGTLDATKVNVTKLNASNITSGTINASVIGVTNLSANSITGGTINASNVTITNLNASNITTGAMNASLITTGSMNAARITAGTITGDRLAVNTIVASKLSVGAANLVNDPTLEAIGTVPFDATTVLGNNGWGKGSSIPTFVDDSTYGRIMKFSNVGGANSTITTNTFYVDPTKAYKVTLRFRYTLSDGTSAATGSMYFGFNSYHSVTSPTTEVGNRGSFEYVGNTNNVFNTSATNPYFYVAGKGQSGTTAWTTVETYLYPTDYYGDVSKLKNPLFPDFGANKKVWFMGSKMNMIRLRLLNYNQSTSFGDGTSTNDLYIASLQVTEVDAGTLTATNIVTGSMNADLITTGTLNANIIKAGTLNADLVSISSGASGVTINSGGLTASNETTGVSVKMNSSTGFEIKKGADTVFTVNSDGSLTAKNIKVNGGTIEGSGLQSISAADANGYSKYVKVQPTEISVGREKMQNTSPVIRHFIGTTINENNIYSSDYYYNDGQTTSNSVTIAQSYIKIQNSFQKQGYDFDGSIVLDVGDYLNRAKLITYGNAFELKSNFDIDITSTGRDVNINALNGITGENFMYGNIIKRALPSVSGQNEIQMDLSPSDGNSLVESTGMRLFSRVNGMGLYSMGSKNNYTFLKFTPTQGTSKKVTELLGEDVSLFANNTLKTDVKNIFDLRVRDAGNTLRSAITIDGTKESYGVWIDIGGGSRTVIYAGESNVNPATHLNMSNDSEVLILEANDSIQMYWSTDNLTRSTSKADFDNTIVGMIGLGGAFRPTVTEKLHLGSTSYRFVTVWAKTTTINSDSRSKHDIQRVRGSEWSEEGFTKRLAKDAVSENRSAEIYEFMKSMPLYQFKYDDMEQHANQFGFIADQLVKYDKNKVADWFIDVPEKEEDRLSVSTQSYAAAIHIALQEEMERNDALEKKVEDLEARLLRLEQLLGGQS